MKIRLTVGGRIQFLVPSAVDEYFELNDTCLLVHATIVKKDGKQIVASQFRKYE